MTDPNPQKRKDPSKRSSGINPDRMMAVLSEELKRFFEEHADLCWLLFLLFVVVVPMIAFGQVKQSLKNVGVLEVAITDQKIDELKKEYPKGFKLLVIDNNKIIPVKYDSLSKIIAINWANARVINNDGWEIKLYLPKTKYKPRNISFESGIATIFQKTGSIYSLRSSKGFELMARILDSHEGSALCLIFTNEIQY